jgi:hypothetical protein
VVPKGPQSFGKGKGETACTRDVDYGCGEVNLRGHLVWDEAVTGAPSGRIGVS